jgi:hypothetical protein
MGHVCAFGGTLDRYEQPRVSAAGLRVTTDVIGMLSRCRSGAFPPDRAMTVPLTVVAAFCYLLANVRSTIR